VTKQLLTQGQATLEVGRGAGVNFQGRNRRTKSREDVTEPGTVYNTDRIAADAITVNELDALDLDVGDVTITNPSTGSQLDFFGNVNGAIAIEPTGAVTLASPFSDAFQAAFIDEIFPPADNDGLVGSSTSAYNEMHAYEFIAAGSGTVYSDGGDPLAGLAEGDGIPDFARRDRGGGGTDAAVSLTDAATAVWDICRAQQRRLEALQERVATLEADSGSE
jgi:hypothetical protein